MAAYHRRAGQGAALAQQIALPRAQRFMGENAGPFLPGAIHCLALITLVSRGEVPWTLRSSHSRGTPQKSA